MSKSPRQPGVRLQAARPAGSTRWRSALALLAGHYRSDRPWTADLLTDAQQRLATWRAAAARGPAGAGRGRPRVAALRDRLADDLDTPAAWPRSTAGPPTDADRPRGRRRGDALLGLALALIRGRGRRPCSESGRSGSRSRGSGPAAPARAGAGSARSRRRSRRRWPSTGRLVRGASACSSSCADVLAHLVVLGRDLADRALPLLGLLRQRARAAPRRRAPPRSGAAAPRRPSGTGPARRSAARTPRTRRPGCRPRRRRSGRPRRSRSGPGSWSGPRQLRRRVRVVGGAADRGRAGVRGVGEQRAERDDLRHAEPLDVTRAAPRRTSATAGSARSR